MAHLTGQFPDLLDTHFKDYAFGALMKWPSEFRQWNDVRTSDLATEYEGGASELPQPGSVGEYAEFPEAQLVEGPQQTWSHTKYGYRVIASEELIEDERFSVLTRTAEACGAAMFHLLETEGIADINNSFTTANVPAGDAGTDEYLCQRSHSAWAGTSGSAQHNGPATDVTLGLDAVWAAVDNFATLNNTQGDPTMKIPAALMIHPNNKRKGKEILQSEDVPFLATNEINAIRQENLSLILMHYASSTTAWWVKTRDNPVRWYFRRTPRIKRDDKTSNESMAWQISTRFSHGPTVMGWMEIYGTDGVA
jgi:hypothetical protein